MVSTPLLERDHLLSALDQRLAEATHGRGSLVVVSGEAGSGKTALVNEWVHRLGWGTVVLEGRCDPLATPRPLSPLLDISRDPESGLGEEVFQSGPDHVFTLFFDRLHRSIRPIVVVFEDVHWADGGTLDFLRFIGSRVERLRAVLVCTVRDDELPPRHPLRSALGDLVTRATVHQLRVEPLSVGAVNQLIGDLDLDAVELHRVTGGNAFFVSEVVGSGGEIPVSVQDSVSARLSRLGEAPRSVVEAASIALRALENGFAMALTGVTPESIDAATASGLLVSDGLSVGFRHDLVRSAVEDALPRARKVQLHRHMIDLLESARVDDLARLAHHAVESGAHDRVADYAPRAAREASERRAHREAIEFYRMALDRAHLFTPDVVAELRVAVASELEVTNDAVAALAERQQAVEHYRAVGDDLAAGRALVTTARSLWDNNRLREAKEVLGEAKGLLTPLGPSEELARALFYEAYFWVNNRCYLPAVEAGRASLDMAVRLDSGSLAARAQHVLGDAELLMGEESEGIQLLSEAFRKLDELGDRRRVHVMLDLGICASEVRSYRACEDALQEALAFGEELDSQIVQAFASAVSNRVAADLGNWQRVLASAGTPGVEIDREASMAPVIALSAVGRVQVRMGDATGPETLREALRVGEGWFWPELWPAHCGLAEQAWWEGRREEIPGILRPLADEVWESDSRWARGEFGYWLWRCGAIDGPPDRSAEPFAQQMDGDWAAAAESWRRIGCPYEEAMALADGDVDGMLAALAIFDALGASPAAASLRATLRKLGIVSVPRGPTAATRAHPERLTPRQDEVLRLLGIGLTNSEIATRLFISKKTVEHHVSAIYSKLGVASRAEAINLASRMRPGEG